MCIHALSPPRFLRYKITASTFARQKQHIAERNQNGPDRVRRRHDKRFSLSFNTVSSQSPLNSCSAGNFAFVSCQRSAAWTLYPPLSRLRLLSNIQKSLLSSLVEDSYCYIISSSSAVSIISKTKTITTQNVFSNPSSKIVFLLLLLLSV